MSQGTTSSPPATFPPLSLLLLVQVHGGLRRERDLLWQDLEGARAELLATQRERDELSNKVHAFRARGRGQEAGAFRAEGRGQGD